MDTFHVIYEAKINDTDRRTFECEAVDEIDAENQFDKSELEHDEEDRELIRIVKIPFVDPNQLGFKL